MRRREFLAGAGGIVASSVAPGSTLRPANQAMLASGQGVHTFNGSFEGDCLDRIAFPLGGIGAGMLCLEGTGALSKFSLRGEPDLVNEPGMFAALAIPGRYGTIARVLEGPVPRRKLFPQFSVESFTKLSGLWGLPRFRSASFAARFPFGTVELTDDDMPVDVRLTGWSPFEPGDEDNASLPVAALEYEINNRGSAPLKGIFSFNAINFMVSPFDNAASVPARIGSIPRGFVLEGAMAERPWTAGSFAVCVDDPAVKVNHAWFRGRSLLNTASVIMAWNDVVKGACYERPPITAGSPSPGASLFVPLTLYPSRPKTIVVQLAWYVGHSNLNLPGGGVQVSHLFDHDIYQPKPGEECYQPWYTVKFSSIEQVMSYWTTQYHDLRMRSERFSCAFYDSTLPPEVLEAVAANLTILKSPTVLRQQDGRFWGWEGCADTVGSCEGSCTHVWNYAQALAHLFPRLERSMREVEFGPNQNGEGHQDFRSAMPIRPTPHKFLAAADGQLGGVMKVYRDWRIGGDTAWVRSLWPKIRASLDYCIRTWDPQRVGWLEEPHHNTYDIEFWGPNGMCTSIYLGALTAATRIGAALQENTDEYAELLQKGTRRLESELYNGEFFVQEIKWRNLRARFPEDAQRGIATQPYSPEAYALASVEGPEHQYGVGCLSDGVLGAWLAWACGIGDVLDKSKVTQHLRAVYHHNFKRDLTAVANPAIASRAGFAAGSEGGLLLCSWPNGGMPSIPFYYANEVWTGVEYQVASHLIAMGQIAEGLEIVRTCRRRYDGRTRNPFSEIEAGHWYARAMSSYALLQALSGASYDAVDQILYLRPSLKGDFRSFLATGTGYGNVGDQDGKPFLEVVSGTVPVKEVRYVVAS